MNGLIIWAQSDCRSTMGLYREMQKTAEFPIKVVLWHFEGDGVSSNNRKSVGFCSNEFNDVEVLKIGEDFSRGLEVVKEHLGWKHLFCVYQNSKVYRQLAEEVVLQGDQYGIMSESPCNMKSGIKRFLWWMYVRTVLKYKVRKTVKKADFFVNFSGDDDYYARILGWRKEKIIPFGYYPPILEGSNSVRRITAREFVVLATGVLSRYRGCDVLIRALKILKEKGIDYKAIITQNGELLSFLKAFADRYSLNVEFAGKVPMSDLIKLYETCSVYVGTGRNEPWGMRLNDALNCGAPLVVSSGMGGRKLVDDFKCGLVFDNNDPQSLAEALIKMISDEQCYKDFAQSAFECSEKISPSYNAKALLKIIKSKWIRGL